MERNQNQNANDSEALKLFKQKSLQLNEVLQNNDNNSLTAPKIFQSIVKIFLENTALPLKDLEKTARSLVLYIKDASIYKKRKMAQRISKIDMTSKILIIRQLSHCGVTDFSLDMCLSKDSRKGKIKDGIMKFQKPKFNQVLAFGSNKNCRLGIGMSDESVDELTPVQISGEISKVHMGQFHTIFEMKNGKLYGCGKSSNFMEGPVNAEENIRTPTRLNYFTSKTKVRRHHKNKTKKRPQKNVTTNIILSDNNTKIVDFSPVSSLIVGTYEADPEDERSHGDNWLIVSKPKAIEENREAQMLTTKTVEVESSKGEKRSIAIRDDGMWIGKNNEKFEIAFLVDGFRVDNEKVWKNYTVCSNGVVFACVDENVYKGKLQLVPRASPKDGDQSSDDDDDDDEEMQDDDVVVLDRDDVLLAVMHELILPMAVNGFKVTEDGESFIVYSSPHMQTRNRKIQYYSTSETPATFDLSCRIRNDKDVFDGRRIIGGFDQLCKDLDMKAISDLYSITGFPRFTNVIRGFLALKHFLRIDPSTGMTEVFVKNVKDNNVLDTQAVEREMHISLGVGNKIPVLTVKADWTEEQKEQRQKEVRERSRNYVLGLIGEVKELMCKLNTLPLEYRANRLDSQFGRFVDDIIFTVDMRVTGRIDLEKEITLRTDNSSDRAFRTGYCEEALKKRVEDGDIQGDAARFKLVRVEAVPILSTSHPNPFFHEQTYHWVKTTRFHIMCLDPKLIEFIDENDVLNLNLACLDDENEHRFQSLLDFFFLLRDDHHFLQNIRKSKGIDVDRATKSLPAREVYTIKMNDFTIKAPKVLFELFSEYDGGRRRHWTGSEKDLNKFNLAYESHALRLLLDCLIDVRSFYRADMALKMEAYDLAEFLGILHIRADLLNMMITTARESEYKHVGNLIWRCTDKGVISPECTMAIATLRPEMIMFWKNLPINGHYLSTLNIIAKKINEQRYKKIERTTGSEDLPIIASRDELIDKQRIDRKFARSFLCNDDQDKDIQWELMKTILSWDRENPNRRKRGRRHAFRDAPI